MRKSREFDNVLDECLERLLVKGETVEQCLQSFPQHADELKPLLETALATKQVSVIQPRSEFRDRARYQFYSALQEMEHKRSRPFLSRGWQPRWATVVAIVLALLLAGGGGTVAAAGGSMPDDLLYPVKLATEQMQLAFTFSDIGKAELNAKLADKRVAEIVYLASEGNPEKIEQTAQRLDGYLTEIASLSSTQEVMVGIAMAPAAEEAETVEETPVEEAPTTKEVDEEAMIAEETLSSGDATTAEEAPLPTEEAGRGRKANAKEDRQNKLKETMEYQANNNSARLRASLETAPESARSALEQAIAISENGYKKAIKALE